MLIVIDANPVLAFVIRAINAVDPTYRSGNENGRIRLAVGGFAKPDALDLIDAVERREYPSGVG